MDAGYNLDYPNTLRFSIECERLKLHTTQIASELSRSEKKRAPHRNDPGLLVFGE